MKTIKKLTKLIPHLYFIAIIVYWFLDIKNNKGASPYLILLLITPFIWQLIKPSRILNIILGSLFILLSSYLILAYLSDIVKITEVTTSTKQFVIVGGIFMFLNITMSFWLLLKGLKAKS